MRRRVLTKLIICYLFAAISMFVLLNTIGVNRLEEKLLQKKEDVLYDVATLIVSEYSTSFYRANISLPHIITQLRTIDTFLGTTIWIVDSDGIVIADTKDKANNVDLNELDSSFLEKRSIRNVSYHELFEEPMLSVITPVVYNYKIKGYVCLHASMNEIRNESIYYLDFINICFLIFLVILFCVFSGIYYITVLPLRKIIKVTMEYTKGNFEPSMNVNSKDEYRDLADQITYMSQELKNLDDYQKKFVANISHDFRSPLTSIKGYAQAILDGTIPYEMQNKYLDVILFEGERLTKLTTNLLELNSFENNGMMIDVTCFDINAVIRKTATTFEGLCTKKKIRLNLVFSAKELYVDADVDKIQQVLYNLIDNAIKFSNQDSMIRVTTEEKGSKIFVAVKDYGIGIPKDSIKKIWERFYKTDTSRGKDKKGTGLGLSITKEIITAHNENINVVSTEGVGTEFVFTLQKSYF